MSPAERWAVPLWAVFAIGNSALMWVVPGAETIPFHLVWISLALVYGVRPWPVPATLAVCLGVAVATGAPLWQHAHSKVIAFEETAEIPLMCLLFLVMVWHVRRRTAAVAEARLAASRERVAHEMTERFVRIATHELRTPITVARGYAEMLQLDSSDPGQASDVSVVVDELGKLSRITGRLAALAWAHQDARDGALVLDLGALVQRVARRWAPVVDGTIRVESAPTPVAGDEERMETALDCLVENAIRHGRAPIALRVRQDASAAVVEVEDHGPGIAPARARELLRGSDSPYSPRSGLGLMIAQGIVEAHSGRIALTRAPSGGLKATIHLPRLRPE
ncbi:sensor histidine kinase [Sphaerisporangium album]|uniref:sensor histidine kinase n=1 Tax=Sphaerisporangium album TaxID=509200 RepID=UPI0015F08C14|nr:HAMP domain-containing sensor histidine kinase [Sphaerisporangium album]